MQNGVHFGGKFVVAEHFLVFQAAKEFGVDLTLNLRSLRLSPAERVREMESALKFAEQLREGVRRISE